MSVIVIGELYYGAFNSEIPIKYIFQILNIEKQATIVECNKETGKTYGEIKAKIIKKSIRIPDNDIWIAALAIQYKIPLVSRDKHFEFVEDLELLKW